MSVMLFPNLVGGDASARTVLSQPGSNPYRSQPTVQGDFLRAGARRG